MKGLSRLAGSVLAVTCLAAPAAAQMGYFGQNNVQYQTFKFKVLKTQHFDVCYHNEEAGGARMAAAWLSAGALGFRRSSTIS